MKFNNSIFRFLLILLSSGCYDPQGENFIRVIPPVADGQAINLAGYSDSLYIFHDTTLTYQVEDGNLQLIRIEGFLNGESLFNNDRPTEIRLDPARFSNGSHKLKVEATFRSGSGSLADILNQETVKIEEDFDVIIDLIPPQEITIARLDTREGSLLIDWSEPDKKNFLRYEVKRLKKNGQNEWYNTLMDTPLYLGPDVTSFKDSTYVGGEIAYQIDIIGYNFNIPGNIADTSIQAIEIQFIQTNEDELTVGWSESKLHANIKHIMLGNAGGPYTYYSPEATSFTMNVGFGDDYPLGFTVVPKFGYEYAMVYQQVYLGEKVVYEGLGTTVEGIARTFKNKKIIPVRGYKSFLVYEVNDITRKIEAVHNFESYILQEPYDIIQSNLEYHFSETSDHFRLFIGRKVFNFNADFTLTSTLTLAANSEFSFAFGITISENNLASFYQWPGTSVLVNLATGKELFREATGSNILTLSNNGAYFVCGDKLYDVISPDTVQLLNTLPYPNVYQLKFNVHNSNELFINYTTSNNGDLYEINAGLITGSFSQVTSPHDFGYDPSTGFYGCVSNEYFYLFDFSSNSIIRRVRIAVPHRDIWLKDNFLYSSHGYILPL